MEKFIYQQLCDSFTPQAVTITDALVNMKSKVGAGDGLDLSKLDTTTNFNRLLA